MCKSYLRQRIVHSGHSLPKWLALKVTFFAHWAGCEGKRKKGFCFVLSSVCKESHFVKVSHPYWYLTSNLSILSFNVMLATVGSCCCLYVLLLWTFSIHSSIEVEKRWGGTSEFYRKSIITVNKMFIKWSRVLTIYLEKLPFLLRSFWKFVFHWRCCKYFSTPFSWFSWFNQIFLPQLQIL